MIVKENVPLSQLTTFHIGGPAKFFVEIKTVEELQQSLDFAQRQNLPLLILGGGSNILVRDEGFDGLVVHIKFDGIEFNATEVVVGAGESWDVLVEQAVEHTLWGLENLSGIPGSVGGALVGGIGAYGASVGQHVSWVEVYNTHTTSVERFSAAECRFGYRDSVFKNRPELIVLRAAFVLSQEPVPDISYKDLAARFNDSSIDLSLVRAAVLAIRADKFPDSTKEGSAGSFFKNLILPKAKAEVLREQYPNMPLFAMPEVAGYKVPLAWLFDHVLHLNGVRKGAVRCFERQPLVLVADRGAYASEVRTYAAYIHQAMQEKFSIDIEEEVVVL